eukprot:XP_014067469.1 PREDICTED: uncharacterized protein LOC106611605 [Salmo salar]
MLTCLDRKEDKWGASFTQILNKIICAPPGLTVAYMSLAVSEANNNLLDPACNTPNGGGIRPKSIPQELIDCYKRGETHAVSALYQLSQVLQLSFYRLRDQFTGLEIHPGRDIYERKNLINEHVPQAVRELLSKMIDSYPSSLSVGAQWQHLSLSHVCKEAVFYYENCKSVQRCHQAMVAVGTGNNNSKERVLYDSRGVEESPVH